MDINYEVIIKYLVKNSANNDLTETLNNNDTQSNTTLNNTFITQKNIFNYSTSFPDKFKNIFTDKFYRYGITVRDDENNNISFWSSLLTLLDKKFIIPYANDELIIINQFKSQLIEKYKKQLLSSFLKDLNKNDIRERLKLEPDIYILQYIVDILDINIFIFDFEANEIFVLYHGSIMNSWKQSLLFAKHNNYWEPIMLVNSKGTTQRLFDYNNVIIKKILTTSIKYFEGITINKNYKINDNIDDVIKKEQIKLKIILDDSVKIESPSINNLSNTNDSESSVKSDTINDIFIDTTENIKVKNDKIDEIKKLNKTKLNKLKLSELLELTTTLGLTDIKKNATKAILLELILKTLM